MGSLTTEELKALNSQVRRILEEREKLLMDVRRIETEVKPSQPPKQSRLF